MTARELGRALVYYAVVGTVAAVAATLAPIPFDGLPQVVATADAVILPGWAASTGLNALAARSRGGRS